MYRILFEFYFDFEASIYYLEGASGFSRSLKYFYMAAYWHKLNEIFDIIMFWTCKIY
jgi:hypothetical protein